MPWFFTHQCRHRRSSQRGGRHWTAKPATSCTLRTSPSARQQPSSEHLFSSAARLYLIHASHLTPMITGNILDRLYNRRCSIHPRRCRLPPFLVPRLLMLARTPCARPSMASFRHHLASYLALATSVQLTVSSTLRPAVFSRRVV